MSKQYETAKTDYHDLNSIAELSDCVEIDAQVFSLMAHPTKAKAAEMYISAIQLWFQEHGVVRGTESIAARYGIG